MNSLNTPLVERTHPDTPVGNILHELDLVRQYLREYRVDAIAQSIIDPYSWPIVVLTFEGWKSLKQFSYDYDNTKVGSYRNMP